MGFLLIAAEIQKLIAQPHQGFPLILEQRLDLRHVLGDVGTEDVPAPHGGKPGQEVVRGQGDVGGLVDEQMDRHRQSPLVFPVGNEVKSLDELPVNHAHQIVEGLVRVRDAAEQGHLFLAHFLQMQVVGAGEPGDLGQVEGGQPDADADQNGF